MSIRAIVLAAGYGTRLKPLTDIIPKPLLPFCGAPILDIALGRIFDAGAEMAAVNTHHLGGMIEGHLAKSPFSSKVRLCHEAEILGTGGPLVNAKDTLSGCDCFILHNGDIVCDFDLRRLAARHIASGRLATLCLIDGPENKVLTSKDGRVLDILGRLGAKPEDGSRLLTYGGVAAISPGIFRFLPETPEFCSVIDAFLKSCAETPGSIGGIFHDAPFWSDIGSFEQYFHAHELALAEGKAASLGLKMKSAADKCAIGKGASLSGFVSTSGKCTIGDNAYVSNCILLDGACVADGEKRRNEVIAPGGRSFHRETPRLMSLKIVDAMPAPLTASSLPEQGSDRKFIRIKGSDGVSRILMLTSEHDKDFGRFLEIGGFLGRHSMPSARILASEPESFAAIMEDLGDATIFSVMNDESSESDIPGMYAAAVDSLLELQTKGTAALISEPDLKLRDFDYEHLRWETSYFKDNFLGLLCGIEPSGVMAESLEDELHVLARLVASQPRTLVHRDFQSQNIIMKDGKARLVDFQGARVGPFTYDLASLLKDPYVKLCSEIRCQLCARHFEGLKKYGGDFATMTQEAHSSAFLLSSLQRNMQALGAYGFLSMKKRKPKYLSFARPCLELLCEGLSETCRIASGTFRPDTLKSLCNQAMEGLSSKIDRVRDGLRQ